MERDTAMIRKPTGTQRTVAPVASLKQCLRLLTFQDKKRLIQILIIQTLMSFLDLIGVALIGLLGTLAITGVQSKTPVGKVNEVLNFLGLQNFTFQQQAAILGIAATVIFIAKTLFSMYFSRLILHYLSRKSALISNILIGKLLNSPLSVIQERTTQESIYALTTGVSTITVGIIGNSMSVITDTFLLLLLSAGLFAYDPLMAGLIFATFSSIGALLYFKLHKKARQLGEAEATLNVRSFSKISEVIISYRESFVRGRRKYYVDEIGEIRLELSGYVAQLAFMPNISKYIIESTVVLGAMLIAASQFFMRDAVHAVAALSVFIAAGSRIAPAVLRIQQCAISIKGNLGVAAPTLVLTDQLKDTREIPDIEPEVKFEYPDFTPQVSVKNLSFEYKDENAFKLQDISLTLEKGSFVAIVGPSGSGKSTFIDLILGLYEPESGEILISNQKPSAVLAQWPGAISYVPQNVSILNGSIRENIGMGFKEMQKNDMLIQQALDSAQLTQSLNESGKNLDSSVGENGNLLSGGQRQRLGIARALFTKPKLLILDEATSALDGQTENEITEAIRSLHGEVTVVMIAHRLSTVLTADKIAYLENGKLLAHGTFVEVREQIPNFDQQARLMGL
jgi:ABC-type bacteriocin/lantibiotic exporter with double-glycine peptidase domain